MQIYSDKANKGIHSIINNLAILIPNLLVAFVSNLNILGGFIILIYFVAVIISLLFLRHIYNSKLFGKLAFKWAFCVFAAVFCLSTVKTVSAIKIIAEDLLRPKALIEGKIITNEGSSNGIHINAINQELHSNGKAAITDDSGTFCVNDLLYDQYKVFLHRRHEDKLQWSIIDTPAKGGHRSIPEYIFPAHVSKFHELDQIYFDPDSSKLGNDELFIIDRVSHYLKNEIKNDKWLLLICGHCSLRGSKEHNDKLGAKRALKVKMALKKQNIPATKLLTISYGELLASASDIGALDHAQNRKVEFIVIPLYKTKIDLALDYHFRFKNGLKIPKHS